MNLILNKILITPCQINVFPYTPKNFLPPQNLHAAAVYSTLRYFFFSRKGLCNKKSGVIVSAHFWRYHTLRGQNGGTPYLTFWLNTILYEKSKTFQLLLNTHFRAFDDSLSCGSLEPPPPWGHKGLS